MLAIVLCVLAFAACYLFRRRSLWQGLVALLVVGYFYGIVRANILTTFSHFTFDAALLGFYLAHDWKVPRNLRERGASLRLWTTLLMGWPCLLLLLPFQPLLVSLVGLRGNLLFIPVLLVGARLCDRDLMGLSVGFAVLNLVVLGFAGAEYFNGVPRFYPYSPVTQIIYMSGDVAGGFFRIPATFANAHSYGGTMVASMPYLIGLWTRTELVKVRLLAISGIGAAMLGILMCAARMDFILGSLMILWTVFATKLKTSSRIGFLLLVAIVGWVAMSNTRLQRFTSLSDTEYVGDRVSGSVNRGFFDILVQHPMGNGLGGGGTSMPYFLQGQIRNPIAIENEYARMLCEEGIIGLVLWLGFVGWVLMQGTTAFGKGPWANARRLAWCLVISSFGTAWIGIGVFTSVPTSALLFLAIGWTATAETKEPRERDHQSWSLEHLPALAE
jgi:hypothetical protein